MTYLHELEDRQETFLKQPVQCQEDHAVLRTEEEYFAHTLTFPYHRLVPL